MSTPIAFTDNVRDLSNAGGYQFEFRCERCGNGYRSAYRTDVVAKGSSLVQAAGRFFGGKVADLSYAAGSWAADRQTNSSAKDKALDAAVGEVRDAFRQCHGCGDWMCHEVCWNEAVGQCVRCSPKQVEELAQLQAEARRYQVQEQLRTTDLVGGADLRTAAVTRCPSCGAKVDGGKFCPECGERLAQVAACRECGTQNAAAARYCAECGSPQAV